MRPPDATIDCDCSSFRHEPKEPLALTVLPYKPAGLLRWPFEVAHCPLALALIRSGHLHGRMCQGSSVRQTLQPIHALQAPKPHPKPVQTRHRSHNSRQYHPVNPAVLNTIAPENVKPLSIESPLNAGPLHVPWLPCNGTQGQKLIGVQDQRVRNVPPLTLGNSGQAPLLRSIAV